MNSRELEQIVYYLGQLKQAKSATCRSQNMTSGTLSQKMIDDQQVKRNSSIKNMGSTDIHGLQPIGALDMLGTGMNDPGVALITQQACQSGFYSICLLLTVPKVSVC